MVTAAGVYTRISQDDGTALGVARQREDCIREAERRGWPVTEVFTDNDVSATRSKVRPAYRRMLDAIEAGRIDAVVVWDVDRLTRTPSELESFIDLADRHKLDLASVGGEIDLATPQGRLTARIKGSVARHEVEQQSRRLKRKYEENRTNGVPHGRIPFGYNRSEGHDTINEAEAEAIRECYRRALAGDSMRTVAAFLNGAGFTTRRGNAWAGNVVARMLRNPKYIGMLTHQGEIIGQGDWEPIIDRDTFDMADAILSNPSRKPGRGLERKYLGSGLYLCGRCGTGMRPIVYSKRKPAYGCPGCFKCTRLLEAVDEVVEAVMVARLRQPDVLSHLTQGNEALAGAVKARDAILARMDALADSFAAGDVTARQLSRINEKMRADLERAEAVVSATRGASALDGIAGPDAKARWDAATLERKRAVIAALADVVILPIGPGVRFSPEQIRFDWRTAAERHADDA